MNNIVKINIDVYYKCVCLDILLVQLNESLLWLELRNDSPLYLARLNEFKWWSSRTAE